MRNGINVGLCGIPWWGTDTGGFVPTHELTPGTEKLGPNWPSEQELHDAQVEASTGHKMRACIAGSAATTTITLTGTVTVVKL